MIRLIKFKAARMPIIGSTYRSLYRSHVHLRRSISTGQGVVDFIHDCSLGSDTSADPFHSWIFTSTRSSHIHDFEDNLSDEVKARWAQAYTFGKASLDNWKAAALVSVLSLAKNKIAKRRKALHDIMDTCRRAPHLAAAVLEK